MIAMIIIIIIKMMYITDIKHVKVGLAFISCEKFLINHSVVHFDGEEYVVVIRK